MVYRDGKSGGIMEKIEDKLTDKEIKYMAGVRKGQEITVERHLINGKYVSVKKTYVSESSLTQIPNIEIWLKKGLKAKEILKYVRDECRFRWVVWYI